MKIKVMINLFAGVLCIAVFMSAGVALGNIQPLPEIVFIDPSVPEKEKIEAQLPENTEVVRLSPAVDGLAQISALLAKKKDLSTVRIISHGNEGYFVLNGKRIDKNFLQDHGNSISNWGRAMAVNGDILFYACNLAATNEGKAFVGQLADLTGADIAASADITGGEIYNGNWNLEYETGQIDSQVITLGPDIDIKLADITWEGDVIGSETDWGNGGNWGGGVKPGSGDRAVIPASLSNYPVIYNYSCGSIWVKSGASITLGASFTVSGISDIDGTVTIQGTGTYNANGAFDASGGAVTFTGAGDLKLASTVTSLGTFTESTSTVTYDGAAQTVDADDYYNIVTSGSGIKTIGGTTNVGGALTIGSGTTLALGTDTATTTGATDNNGTITASTGTFDANGAFDATGGNVTFTGAGDLKLASTVTSLGTFTESTSTVTYDGAAQAIFPDTYYNLSLAGSGVKTASDNVIVSGAFTNSKALTISGTDKSLTVTGTSSIGAGITTTGIQTYTGAVTLTDNATFDADNDNITFDSTVAGTSSDNLTVDAGTGTVSFGNTIGAGGEIDNMSITSDDISLAAALTASGAGNITLATSSPGRTIGLAGGSGNYALISAEFGYLNAGSDAVRIGTSGGSGSGIITIGADLNAGSRFSTLHLKSNSTVTGTAGGIIVTGLAITAGGTINFSDTSTDVDTLAVTASGQTVSFKDADALVIDNVDGVTGVTATTFNLTTAGAITDAQASTISGVTTVAAGSGNNVTLNHVSNNFGTMAITSGNDVTLVDTDALILGASTVSGTLIVTAGGALTDSEAVAVTGAATLAAGSNNIVLDHASNNFSTLTITSGNDVTINDTDALTITAVTNTLGGKLDLTAGGSGITINDTAITTTTTQDYNNAVILGANLVLTTTNSNINFDGTLDGTGANAQSLTVNGGSGGTATFSNHIGGTTAIDTLILTNGNLATSGKNISASGLTVSAGTFNSASAAGTWDINGNLSIAGGTLKATSGDFNVSGNWSNSATFTANNGTVTLDGSGQALTGDTSFYNLTKNVTAADTLTFQSGSANKTIITNTLNLSGASGQLLSLRSNPAGTQWEIDPQVTRTISYLDVKDANNVNAAILNAIGTNSTDSGNNTNWSFVAASAASTSTPTSTPQVSSSYKYDASSGGAQTNKTIQPGVTVTGGKILGIITNNGTLEGVEIESDTLVTGGQISGGITNKGTIQDVTIIKKAVVSGGKLKGNVINKGTLYGSTILSGAQVTGGTLGGTIKNAGVLADITLAAGAKITGGEIKGTISGDPNSPAIISAVINQDATLTNVIIGKGSSLSPSPKLGAGVKFEENNLIPDGLYLGPLMCKGPGSFPSIGIYESIDLKCDVLSDFNSIILEDINALPFFSGNGTATIQNTMSGNAITQNSLSGTIDMTISGAATCLRVTSVVQKNDQNPGVTFNDDGTVIIVTDTHRMITLHPMIAYPPVFCNEVDDDRSNELINYDSGIVSVKLNSLATIVSKPDSKITPSSQTSQETCWKHTPCGKLANFDFVSLVFNENGKMWEQMFYPGPKNSDEIKNVLSAIPGISDIKFYQDGIIQVTLDGNIYQVLLDYDVKHAVNSQTNALQILLDGDHNGDGIEDFKMIYSNGDEQIMYMVP